MTPPSRTAGRLPRLPMTMASSKAWVVWNGCSSLLRKRKLCLSMRTRIFVVSASEVPSGQN